jgi:hypothetical protein
MTAQLTADELRDRIEKMAQYYIERFDSRVDMVQWYAYTLLTNVATREEAEQPIRKFASFLSGFYQKIPFEDLPMEDFYPLFEVRNLVPEYEKAVSNFLDDPSEPNRKRLATISLSMVETGIPFGKTFDNYVSRYRSLPGKEHYNVIVSDPDGKKWYWPDLELVEQ